MTAQAKPYNRFIIPVLMGVVIAIIKIIISAIQYKYYLEDYKTSAMFFGVSLVLGVLLLLATALWLKRKNGGVIVLKQAFQGIFITILIFTTANFVYDQLSLQMDPTMKERIYKGQSEYAKTLPNGANRAEELKKNYELDKTAKVSVTNLTTQLLSQIVWYSILGFIFALSVSRNKVPQ